MPGAMRFTPLERALCCCRVPQAGLGPPQLSKIIEVKKMNKKAFAANKLMDFKFFIVLFWVLLFAV
jgi:hypothetical protein